MEAHLNELIEKIKNDGVKTAEDKAAAIIADAEAKAAKIVSQAEKDAEQLKVKAKQDAARFEAGSKDAVRQAARNLLIELRKNIEDMLTAIVADASSEALKGASLSDSIVSVMKEWSASDVSDLSLLLPEVQLKGLEQDLMKQLADKMKKGLEIKPFSDLDAGFRISSKDGKMFYDFSDEELSKMISRYLNKRIQEILQ